MKALLLIFAFFFDSAFSLECYSTGVATTASDELNNYYLKETLKPCPNFTLVHQKYQEGTAKYEFWINHSKNPPSCYKIEIRLNSPPKNGEYTHIVKKGCYPSGACQGLQNFVSQEAPDLQRDSGIVTKCVECNTEGCNSAARHFTFLPLGITVMAAIRHFL